MTALDSWNDGVAKKAIVEFVEQTVSNGVPVEERVAVFDNAGTLWCEKPMPIQADFIIRRLVAMANSDADLRNRQHENRLGARLLIPLFGERITSPRGRT